LKHGFRRAKLDRTAKESLELPQVGIPVVGERDFRGDEFAARDHSQGRPNGRDDVFHIVPRGMPWQAKKLEFDG
jgi:hypothetical protein